MAATCTICGKKIDRSVADPKHPDKRVCLDCLRGLVFNMSTVEETLKPMVDAFTDALAEIKDEVEEGSK
jgi:hypothetical protein